MSSGRSTRPRGRGRHPALLWFAGHRRLTRELLGAAGPNVYLEKGFQCEYGSNIHAGANFYCNFNGVMVDCSTITVGDSTMIGPDVTIGDRAVIASDVVVTRDVCADSLVAAVPAVPKKRIDNGG